MASQRTTTPFAGILNSRTSSERGAIDDELRSIERNLMGHAEYTEDVLPKGHNVLAVSDQEIDQFLEVASVYDEDEKLWRLPLDATTASELRTPIRKIITSIIRFLGWKSKSRGRFAGIRTVVDTHAKALLHKGHSLMEFSSPSLVVKASGPSFQGTHGDPLDYTGITTCLEIQPCSEMETWTSMDAVCHLGVYAKQIFVQQPNRRFVRCLFMTEQHASLVHFDRAGAQYTPFFNIHEDPYTFTRLVLTVSSFDERELGLDTRIRWRVECGLKVGGTISVLHGERTYAEYCMLDVNPIAMHHDIRCRGLRIWRVRDGRTGKELCIKDAWISEDDTLEYKLLERVRGVQGVVQMISYDIGRTTTRACRVPPAYLEVGDGFSDTCHKMESRIVLEAYGDNIVHCGVEEQAIAAFRDVIAALRNLRGVGLYHRDISSGNVLLGKRNALPGARGILIDLDMACDVYPLMRGSDDAGVGTFPYMSIAILRNNYDHGLCTRQYRDHLDDLESIFYLFCEVVFYWDRDTAPLWWNSDDLYECAAAKLLTFCIEPDEFETDEVDPEYSNVSCELLKRFFAFIQEFVVKKEEINTMGDPQAEERERLGLIDSWGAHFDRLLSIFDDALEELGIPGCHDDNSTSPSVSPTPTLAERLETLALSSRLGSKGHL